jgi:integrase
MTLYKRGSTFWFRFKWRGLVIRESAHTSSRTAALKAERGRRNELDEGASKIKTVKPLLFSKAAKEWLALKEVHWTPATRRAEGYNVDHLVPHFGTSLLTDISADNVTRYQAARKREGASARTVNMETGTLRAVLRKHRLWAAIQPDVKPLSARSDVGRAISRDEETRLLAAARKSRSRSLYPALVTAIHTGLRSAELRTLQWSRVDLIEACLTVGKSKTAGGEGRIVPLSATALAVLKEWRAQFPDAKPAHYVFPSERVGLKGQGGRRDGTTIAYDTDPGQPIGSWKTAFNTAKKTAGIQMRMHDTRHTFCSRAGEAGAPEQTLTAMAGWMSPKMLETYSHSRMEAKRRVVASFDLDCENLREGAQKGAQQSDGETPKYRN